MAKSDNSHLAEKVALRLRHLPHLKKIRVLDVFGGDGTIWAIVKLMMPCTTIERTALELIRGKDNSAIIGDNVRLLPGLDLHDFDVIDVDAYGQPVEILQEIAKSKFRGVVFFTIGKTRIGNMANGFFERTGATRQLMRSHVVLNQHFQRLTSFFLLTLFRSKEILSMLCERKSVMIYGVIKNMEVSNECDL